MMRFSKIISFFVVIILVFATVPICNAASEPVIVYEQLDITESATGKFWVDVESREDMVKNAYSRSDYSDSHWDTDFSIDEYGWETIVQWPMNMRETADGVISGELNDKLVIISNEGITYNMPVKEEKVFVDGKETINLLNSNSVTVPMPKKYDKLYFLVGNADTEGLSTKTITATVKYEGEAECETNITNAMVPYKGIRTASSNYVGVMSTLSGATSYTTWNGDNGNWKMTLFEYALELDSTKVIESITFSANQAATAYATTNVLTVVAITGMRDWSGVLTETDEAIADAVENNTDIEKIFKAIDMVNDIKAEGLEEHLENMEIFNQLFTDVAFVDTVLERIYPEDGVVDWEYLPVQLAQTKSVTDAIPYEEMTENGKQILDNAFAQMIAEFINCQEPAEIRKEYFDLLKNSEIDILEALLNEQLVWIEQYSVDVDVDYISFNIEFSSPVDTDMLNADNLILSRDGEKVIPEHVSFDVLSDTCVAVKIINNFDYKKPYVLEISTDISCIENEKIWAYEHIYTESVTSAFAVNGAGIVIENNTITGTAEIINNSNNMQNYSLLVAVYNEKGMMMGSEIFSGSVRALSVDSPTIECTLPDGYKKIICYLMDGYVDARLLAEPFVLK